MRIGKACAIFLNIDSPDYSPNEKGRAIQMVADMPTHNGITKDSMLRVIKWLWSWVFSESSLTTVADLLAVMPDEQLSVLLASFAASGCVPAYGRDYSCECDSPSKCASCWLNWLRQPTPADLDVDWTK